MKNIIGLYVKLSYIRQNGYLPLVLRFTKVNTFHITLECLISVYMLELFASFTRFYLTNPTIMPNLLMLVILPSITMIPLSIIFGIWCALFFIDSVYSYSNDILKQVDTGIPLDTIYDNTYKRYQRDVVLVHSSGLAIYVISTILVPSALIFIYPEQFSHPARFVFHMAIIGFLLGTVWNITGIFRNQRIIWHDVLPIFNTSSIRQKVSQSNFKCFVYNAVGSITSLTVLCILAIIIVFNIHPEIVKVDIFARLLTEYSFFVLSFAALVAFYIKTCFNFLYASSNKDVNVFPSLDIILKPCEQAVVNSKETNEKPSKDEKLP